MFVILKRILWEAQHLLSNLNGGKLLLKPSLKSVSFPFLAPATGSGKKSNSFLRFGFQFWRFCKPEIFDEQKFGISQCRYWCQWTTVPFFVHFKAAGIVSGNCVHMDLYCESMDSFCFESWLINPTCFQTTCIVDSIRRPVFKRFFLWIQFVRPKISKDLACPNS
jgi:hypothetical protein